MNRNLTSKIAEFHFAPTEFNKNNLLKENIAKNVYVTGNTVIDAFRTTVKKAYSYKNKDLLNMYFSNKRIILMTAHRRENLGKPLENICKAVQQIVEENDDIIVIYPVHLNPIVRETANSILGNMERVYLIEPIDVEDMHNLMARSYLVMTDSGGLQEEAPSCGIPVLVMRTETERPEAVHAGTVKVVGVKSEDIYNATQLLLNDKTAYEQMAKAINPYGDGHASERIVKILIDWSDGKNF
jgi:UDP-N-acetylglucosamine 2-epimerase (non-hydrolysing)